MGILVAHLGKSKQKATTDSYYPPECNLGTNHIEKLTKTFHHPYSLL